MEAKCFREGNWRVSNMAIKQLSVPFSVYLALLEAHFTLPIRACTIWTEKYLHSTAMDKYFISQLSTLKMFGYKLQLLKSKNKLRELCRAETAVATEFSWWAAQQPSLFIFTVINNCNLRLSAAVSSVHLFTARFTVKEERSGKLRQDVAERASGCVLTKSKGESGTSSSPVPSPFQCSPPCCQVTGASRSGKQRDKTVVYLEMSCCMLQGMHINTSNHTASCDSGVANVEGPPDSIRQWKHHNQHVSFHLNYFLYFIVIRSK